MAPYIILHHKTHIMKTLFFSARSFEIPYLKQANINHHEIELIREGLTLKTSQLAEGMDAIALFSGDDASAPVLKKLKKQGVKFITTRSAGFNHIDLEKAKELKLKVARVPAYSPFAIAEHTIALMLTLNRKIIHANRRIKELNFSLDGLVGFDMHGKTVGVIGAGEIGSKLIKILNGFGCKILAFDINPNRELEKQYNIQYVELNSLLKVSDIINLHVPLNKQTHYIINKDSIDLMKKGVMLINTGRGKLLDTKAVIDGLKSTQIGYLGLDVYEEEEGLFFEDHSNEILQDDVIARLMTFKNVLITSHQAFLTDTALRNIASTTFENLDAFKQGKLNKNFLVE